MPDGLYRGAAPQLQEAWDWDLIVYPDGSLRVIAMTHGCLYNDNHLGARCECADRPRMSSPIVDKWGAPLQEAPYDPARLTGAGRHLLTASEGTEIRVLSGKTYRLNGPRVPAPNFSGASVWEVYKPRLKKCRMCQGVGFTRWASFVTGLGNLLGHLAGAPNKPWPCSRCGGSRYE